MNRTFVLKHIEPMSCGKLLAAIYGVLGLITGAILSVVSLLGKEKSPGSDDAVGALFGVAAVILLPVVYVVIGFLSGLLSAAVFNIFARMVGGVALSGDVESRT